jgi:hypothetical protein
METRRFRVLSMGLFCMVFLASTFASPASPRRAMQEVQPVLDLPPDPDGESSATITLTNTSGDPSGTISAGYVLDDGSVVVNIAGVSSGSQSSTYNISVDENSNTYSIAADAPQDIPPCIAGSARLETFRKSDGSTQVRTTDRLIWRIVGGTVGFTSFLDNYQAVNGGGLTWNIVKSPVDPPYTTSRPMPT